MTHQQYQYNLDSATQLKDAGLVAASAAATVGGVAAYVDLGGAGYQEFDVVIDWTACEVATGDEVYEVQIQADTSSGFATAMEVVARQKFGANIGGSNYTGHTIDTPAIGRDVIHADNVIQLAAQTIPGRYIRVYTLVSGTVATGFNFTAYLVPRK